MPFGVVSGVGRGTGVLDGVVIVQWEGAVFEVTLRRPIVTNVDILLQLCESDALFPNYFGEDFLFTAVKLLQRLRVKSACAKKLESGAAALMNVSSVRMSVRREAIGLWSRLAQDVTRSGRPASRRDYLQRCCSAAQ